ncbi:MAG TPA: hypothetical protein VLA77_03630 [Candidatus Saccharimonadales bacterium]|nr:hypothetical protein [Candidatus Saccharimonadales bacterium]
MSILIGITGAIGSGKTTFSDFLAAAEPSHTIYETWHVVGEIATAFNQALKAELEFETFKNKLELANQALIWLPDAISEYTHFDLTWNQLAITKRDQLENSALYEKLWIYLDHVSKNPSLLNTTITTANKETYRPLLQWVGAYLVAKASKTIWYDEIFRRIELRDKDTNLVIINGVRYPSDAEIVRKHGGKIIEIVRPQAKDKVQDPTESSRNEIEADVIIRNEGNLDDLAQQAYDLLNNLKSRWD